MAALRGPMPRELVQALEAACAAQPKACASCASRLLCTDAGGLWVCYWFAMRVCAAGGLYICSYVTFATRERRQAVAVHVLAPLIAVSGDGPLLGGCGRLVRGKLGAGDCVAALDAIAGNGGLRWSDAAGAVLQELVAKASGNGEVRPPQAASSRVLVLATSAVCVGAPVFESRWWCALPGPRRRVCPRAPAACASAPCGARGRALVARIRAPEPRCGRGVP